MSGFPTAIIIPARTIRQNCPMLEDFGTSPGKNIIKLSIDGICYQCPNVEPENVLVISERLVGEYDLQIKRLLMTKGLLNVVVHDDAMRSPLIEDIRENKSKAVFHPFHRTRIDPIYPRLLTLFAAFQSQSSPHPAEFHDALNALKACLQIDHQLERQFGDFHRTVRLPKKLKLPENAIVVCNEGPLAEQFRKTYKDKLVAVTPEALDGQVKAGSTILIQAELKDEEGLYTRFKGYEAARMLAALYDSLQIAFISFLPRKELYAKTDASRLLTPIFPHFQIPNDLVADEALCIPEVSAAKSTIIQNYYLRDDGIVDKLLHDLKKLGRNSNNERIIYTLDFMLANARILTDEILTKTKGARATVEKNNPELFRRLKSLEHLLEEYYAELVQSEPVAGGKHVPDKIIIVEDDPETLAALMSGLQGYFSDVHGFTNGEEALKMFQKNPRSVSALLADMELLDENRFWQPRQGYDLIEEVQNYPHLVIYMLTAFSKRALSSIQNTLSTRKINYVSKDPILGLPPDIGYAAFAERLQEQIQKRRKLLGGPQQGVWRKGLSNFYYKIVDSKDGAALWNEAIADVERFFQAGQSNKKGMLPKQLFNVGTMDFKRRHLEAVLRHRLVCLYRQYQENVVFFEKGVQKSIGFSVKTPRQYFTTILGFSISFAQNEPDASACIIHKHGLFPEELAWLKTKFPEDEATNFPRLFVTLRDAVEQIPPFDRQKNAVYSKNLAKLADCLPLLKAFKTLPENVIEDISVDLNWYRQNETSELNSLKNHPAGTKVATIIIEWV